jgi:hypothetical protein
MSTDNTSLEDILAGMDNDEIIITDEDDSTTDITPQPDPEPTPDPEPDDESDLEDDIDDPEPDDEPDPNIDPEPSDDDQDDQDDDEPNSLVAYYETLREQGLIQVEDDFEFDGTSETFSELIEDSKSNIVREGMANWFESTSARLSRSHQICY